MKQADKNTKTAVNLCSTEDKIYSNVAISSIIREFYSLSPNFWDAVSNNNKLWLVGYLFVLKIQ